MVSSIHIVTPSNLGRVNGVVSVDVAVTGGSAVSAVTVIVGDPAIGSKPATHVSGGTWRAHWDTRRSLEDPSLTNPSDAMYWITATAVVDGALVRAPMIRVTTANLTHLMHPATVRSGWRPKLAWSAKYDGTFEQWKKSHGAAVIGARHAALLDDPLVKGRKAIRVILPNSAKNDSDQPKKTTLRFQSSGPRTIVEGDEFCVGFAFYPPPDFPSVYPRNDPTNPAGKDASGYLAIFQFYGPPYVKGSPLVLHAHRRTLADPVDEFNIRGNSLNPGDPADQLAIPYRRGRWTDVVFKIHASTSIERGWMETYVNQGEGTAVKPLTVNGLTRLPRVLLRPDSQAFRTDMQIYRVVDRIPTVTLWHTGHTIAQTVEQADPRSYRNGPKA
ncbi:MAG TPA: hypothetical protein VGC94_03050 [Amnibacterium sp.]